MGRTEGPLEEVAEHRMREGPFYHNQFSDDIRDDPVSDEQSPAEQVREERTPEERASGEWRKILGPYGGADLRRSLTQILTSAAPFFVFWYAAYRALSVSYWPTLILAVPTALAIPIALTLPKRHTEAAQRDTPSSLARPRPK